MKKHREPLMLVTGEDQSAYSRFVLPFAWKKEEDSPGDPGDSKTYYAPVEKQAFKERYTYFTRETGRVLFERARWLELRYSGDAPWDEKQAVHLTKGKTIIARMGCPRMVLFECDCRQSSTLLQTGFLLVDIYLEPHKEGAAPALDDLLLFNEFFRYVFRPHKKHFEDGEKPRFRDIFPNDVARHGSNTNTDTEQYKQDDKTEQLTDDAIHKIYFDRWAGLLKYPAELDGKRYRIVSDEDIDAALDHIQNPVENPERDFLIYADNRTYVWSAAVLENGVQELKNMARSDSSKAADYGHWVKLLNVDPPGKTQSRTHHGPNPFEREWANERTYKRWESWGTWYGFSSHSGVMLAKHPEPNDLPVVDHFSTFYFDIVLLLLYLRVNLFRFSNEIGNLFDQGKLNETEFEEIREAFAQFTIHYQFPTLSNQQQAIEMYSLARKHFDIDPLFDEVKAEIHETYEYLEMKRGNRLAHTANVIAQRGLPLAAGGVAAGVLGVNIDDFNLVACWPWINGACEPNLEFFSLAAIIFATIFLFNPLLRWFTRYLFKPLLRSFTRYRSEKARQDP